MSIQHRLAEFIWTQFYQGDSDTISAGDAHDLADAILAGYGVVELPEPSTKFTGSADEHAYRGYDTELVTVTAWEGGDFEFQGNYTISGNAEQLRKAAAALLAAANALDSEDPS